MRACICPGDWDGGSIIIQSTKARISAAWASAKREYLGFKLTYALYLSKLERECTVCKGECLSITIKNIAQKAAELLLGLLHTTSNNNVLERKVHVLRGELLARNSIALCNPAFNR